MASKRIACGTATTPAPVITRCSCSISSVIWNAARCVLAMSTAPTAGRMCSTRSCNAIEARSHASFSSRCSLRHAGSVHDYLEAERVKYAIRIPTYQVLQNRIGYLLQAPVGRPPNEVRRY